MVEEIALPAAMPSDARTVVPLVASAAKAPTKTAGAAWGPSTNAAARARPLGGQTAETIALWAEKERPSLATPK